MLKSFAIALVPAALLTVFAFSLPAEQLPPGTTLEVRLSVATGSRISHPGDSVEGTIIAPVLLDGRLVVPQGSTVSGVVDSVQRLGFGLKHLTASIRYSFNTLRLPDGEIRPIDSRLVEVETAKERVNGEGTVGGIHPTANLSSSVSLYALPFLYAAPAVVGPALGIKFLIARSPDPEIYFPPGTEIILELNAPVEIGNPTDKPTATGSFSADEIAGLQRLLDSSTQQAAAKKSGRPADLVNILFLGTREQIDRAFYAAGWSGPQRGSAVSLFRMYHSCVQRIGYSMAPMAQLTLNGKAPDAAYEKSLDTFSKRHHLRLWNQQSGLWLSAATEDVSYKIHRMHLTHATDPRIDNERAKVMNDLDFTGCVDAATLLRRASSYVPDQRRQWVFTDGDIAVIRLNDCRTPRTMPALEPSFTPGRHRRFVQGLLALRNDVVRSNLVFLGYNTLKLFSTKEGPQIAAHNAPNNVNRGPVDSPASFQATWVRESRFGASTNAP